MSWVIRGGRAARRAAGAPRWGQGAMGLVVVGWALGVQPSGTIERTLYAAHPEAEQRGDPRVRVPDAQRTIAQRLPAFRRCFEDMNTYGQAHLTLIVAGEGGVRHAEVEGHLPRPVVECLQRRALSTVFRAPEGGRTARLHVPVVVLRQWG